MKLAVDGAFGSYSQAFGGRLAALGQREIEKKNQKNLKPKIFKRKKPKKIEELKEKK